MMPKSDIKRHLWAALPPRPGECSFLLTKELLLGDDCDFEDMLGVMDEWALDILFKRMSDEEMNRKVAPRGTCDSVERIMSIHSIRSTVCGLDFRLPEHYREVVFDSLRPDGKRYRGDRIHRHL